MPDTRDGRPMVVRPYRASDRHRVRHICSETGFLGQPQEGFFIGREEFADLFCSYYTDYEPEHCFVGEVDGLVVGYALSTPDSERAAREYRAKIMPMVRRKAWRNGWFLHWTNLRYLHATRRGARRGEMKPLPAELMRDYPAHLHINICDPALRGVGLGKAMMLAVLDHLRGLGAPGVHLGTTDHNRQAVPFYHGMGFQILFRRFVTYNDHALPDPPVENLVFGMRLLPQDRK